VSFPPSWTTAASEWPGLTPIVDPWVNPMTPVNPGATPFKPEDFIKLVKPQEKDEGRLPTKAEMEAFLKLVKAAEEFDKKANQPHCEDPEKIKLLHAIEERLERIEEAHKRLEERNDNHHVGSMIYGSSNLPSHIDHRRRDRSSWARWWRAPTRTAASRSMPGTR
jgi:hypothetical protein